MGGQKVTPGSVGQASPAPEISGRPQRGRRITPGAQRRMHTAHRPDPAPPSSEGGHRQGLGRLAHTDAPHSPPKWGLRTRPLQCLRRSLQSCAVGVIFRQSLQRPYLCGGLHPLR
ncbi:hypothetical protein NDU88_002816 [Pleurodeles waltl]|uniref:Uncharacterized protein n=1 Tax=Pleurodeles waltl TaxID=8319 RepID=A0AAV7SFW7_PLEWA|nr:hypothetical protein NDU88_002816 [Pleurodeles waltl]